MMEIVKFDSLPLWRGVRSARGVSDSPPFGLVLHSNGYIRQNAGGELRQKIINAYADPNYVFITPPPGSSEWADRLGAAKIQSMLAVCGSLDDVSVLEIGAGNLVVARQLIQRFRISRYVAVDPTLPNLQDGVIESLPLFFPSEALVDQKFDLVIGFSCLEHVDDPVHFLVQARDRLGPHGRIVLTFPDVESMLSSGDLNALVHEHLSYFDLTGFRNVAKRAGVDIMSLISRNGLFTALLKRSEQNTSSEVIELPTGTLDRIRKSYHYVVDVLGAAIRNDLDRGKHVSFHGACPGLNNFLWLSGLSNNVSVMLADGDRSKWGRYLPACYCAIKNPEDPQYLGADIIHVAATNFFSEIRQNLVAKGVAPDRIVPLSSINAIEVR